MCIKKMLCALGVGLASVASVFAQEAAVTLPDTGVNVAGYLTAALTSVGGIIGICVGACLALWGINFGIKWWRSKAK